MNKAQQKLFGDSTAPNYLVSEKGPTISQGLIEGHIKELHSKCRRAYAGDFSSSACLLLR